MIVTTIFLNIILFLVAVILIPIKIRFLVKFRDNDVFMSLKLDLIYGILSFLFIHEKRNFLKFFIGGFQVIKKEMKKDDKEKEWVKKRDKEKESWVKRIAYIGKSKSFNPEKLLRSAKEAPELRQPIIKILSGVIKAIHVKEFNIKGKIGGTDPYISGTLFGMYSALTAPIDPRLSQKIIIEPNFAGESDVELILELVVVQSLVIIPLILLLSKRPFRRIIKSKRGKKDEN